MTFLEKLEAAIDTNNSLLCVGLDADFEKLPDKFKNDQYPQFSFSKWVVDETAQSVCAYKPNTAFFEARGIVGITELKLTCDFIRTTYPNIPIILDAKRGDIGNTNNGYVSFAFNYLQADAITLHPYLGKEALDPFLQQKDKGSIILCKTSNPGSGELQDLKINDESLHVYLANKIATEWNTNGNCMLVVGATYPKEIAEIRQIIGDMTMLVPGIGAQGGDLAAAIQAGLNSKKKGVIINASRSIIFANNPKAESEKLKNDINSFR